MRRVLTILTVAAMLGAGCGDDLPTEPDPLPTPAAVDVFIGTLAVGGSGFYSFTLFEPGSVHVLVANVRRSGTNEPVTAPVALGIGRPQGTGCSLTEGERMVTAGLSAQHRTTLDRGVYCVNFADRGGLTDPVEFLIRIIYPIERYMPAGGTGTSTFASTLLRGGVASRAFGLSNAGTLRARLDSLSPASAVGLALGVPALIDSTCLRTVIMDVPAGATLEIAAEVDGGDYCVVIFDRGEITTDSVNFSIDIIRP
jgi:hypothetical protein